MKNEKFDQVIDEVYKHYQETHQYEPFILKDEINLSKEVFIKKATNNYGFSQLFGISLNERELSWEERRDLLTPEQYDGTALNKYGHKDCGFGYISPFTDKVIHYWMNLHNIPTKQITLTYNDQKIEVYEFRN
jgi:hypothetical protein